jgi:hypothetical protein
LPKGKRVFPEGFPALPEGRDRSAPGLPTGAQGDTLDAMPAVPILVCFALKEEAAPFRKNRGRLAPRPPYFHFAHRHSFCF